MKDNSKELKKNLVSLHQELRDKTMDKYKRVNPFYEDLFDWKERGDYLFGKGKNITVYNSCSVVGDVKVGANSWIGPFSSLDGTGGIEIGDYCSISAAVHILTHDTVKWALSAGKANYDYNSIKIGNACFIGIGAVITKGVSIGDHCLVAANAVVTKSFESHSIIAGVPAKKIGTVQVDGDQVNLDYYA